MWRATRFAGPTFAVAFRPGFQSLFDALGSDDRVALGVAWDRMAGSVAKLLDGPARNDLRAVATRLAREPAPSHSR